MKTHVQQTSLLSYWSHSEDDLNQRQQQVLAALRSIGPATNLDIAEYLNRPVNVITPRMNELVSKNMVEIAYKDTSKQTGRLSIYWRAVE